MLISRSRPPIIVTDEDHRFLASEELREIAVELGCALLEPVGRNTAPALILAALNAMVDGTDPVLVVTPADQTLVNADAFTFAMQKAVAEAANGTIVILGMTPDKPEAGYGYIETDKSLGGESTAIRLRPLSWAMDRQSRSALLPYHRGRAPARGTLRRPRKDSAGCPRLHYKKCAPRWSQRSVMHCSSYTALPLLRATNTR